MLSCLIVVFLELIICEMESFSLKDEGNDLFITQESCNWDKMEVDSDDLASLFGDIGGQEVEVGSGSVASNNVPDKIPQHYSDISEDEGVFEKSSFQ